MLYGIAIRGNTAEERTAALEAALALMHRDFIKDTGVASRNFLSQPGKFVLYLRPAPDDPDADKMRRLQEA